MNTPTTPKNPPITVSVRTDNLKSCELTVADRDGTSRTIKVPSDGNVYQGLFAVRAELERVFNDVLEMHGVLPPPPPSEVPPPVDTSALEAEVQALRDRKAAIEAREASLDKQAELEHEKAKLEDELAKGPAEG